MDLDTLAIHGGFDGDRETGATAVPIFQCTAYAHDTAAELSDIFQGRAPGYIYTRIANPTTGALERRLAQIEGGVGCIATASGMAAISATATALLRAGDHIVAAAGIFGGTASLFTRVLARFGIATTFVDGSDTDAFAAAVTDRTRMLFVETIGNPKMDVPDFAALGEIAARANIPLVVDSTATTPVLFRGGRFADVVIHSTSKFINGHGTAIGGAIIDTGRYDWTRGPFQDLRDVAARARRLAFLASLRNLICRDLGCCAAPMNSFLTLQGIETLPMRIARHCDNALQLARWLQAHPKVRQVRYPGLEDHPQHGRTRKYFGGRGGAVLTISFEDRRQAQALVDKLTMARNLANLGDARTLVIHPGSTIFHELGLEQKQAVGADDDTVRISVGLEDFADIRNDFEQALKQL